MNFFQLNSSTAIFSQSSSQAGRSSSGARCKTDKSCFCTDSGLCFWVLLCLLQLRVQESSDLGERFLQMIVWHSGQTRKIIQLPNTNQVQNRLHFASNTQIGQCFLVLFQFSPLLSRDPKTTRDHKVSYSLSSLLLKPRASHRELRVVLVVSQQFLVSVE